MHEGLETLLMEMVRRRPHIAVIHDFHFADQESLLMLSPSSVPRNTACASSLMSNRAIHSRCCITLPSIMPALCNCNH